MMVPVSLLKTGRYSSDWVKDFYTQSDIWWGPDAGEEYYTGRLQAIERLGGPAPKHILELGAGSGAVAVALAKNGHMVTAVELTTAIQAVQEQSQVGWKGSLRALEADFYTVELEGSFDVVCYWDGFGVGTDGDQRRLLRRIAGEWLAPGGTALIDVFHPARFARHAGSEEVLPPLKGVPGSVEMHHRCRFDPLHCRWIDEWEPTAEPEKALAQSVRCYTPADLRLLLDGTGLALRSIEIDGQALEIEGECVTLSGPLLETYSYLARMNLENP